MAHHVVEPGLEMIELLESRARGRGSSILITSAYSNQG